MATKFESCHRDGQTITYRRWEDLEDEDDFEFDDDPGDMWLAIAIGVPLAVGLWALLLWLTHR